MALSRRGGAPRHLSIADLPDLLIGGDVLVLNDTRVIPARLFFRDVSGRAVELLLVRRLDVDPNAGSQEWECLGRPGRRLKPGARLKLGDSLAARIVVKSREGLFRVEFRSAGGDPESEVGPLLERLGHVPLPPYIERDEGRADRQDREDYQTVYAREPGAIAAPTAGLHLTPELLQRISAKGVDIAYVTLHVGIGTFRPVKAARVEDHAMDKERATVPAETAATVTEALAEGRRIVAVGTTSLRTLEAAARRGAETPARPHIAAGSFETDLFFFPGAEFRVVSALLTNLHLPRSTLLMLVAAFAGRENVLAAYAEAVRTGYRFFSYGDAMFLS